MVDLHVQSIVITDLHNIFVSFEFATHYTDDGKVVLAVVDKNC